MAHENLSKGHQKVPEADTFFINSDATSNNEFSFHNEWLVRGVAVTSGGPEFLEKIKRPKRGDTLLLCTDGFWELITEADMERSLKLASSADDWLALMEMELRSRLKPTSDNYSAVALWLGEPHQITVRL